MLHFGHCSEGIVVMKYYAQGSLWNYLSKHKLTCKEMLVLSFSLVNGLTFLHGSSYRTNGKFSRFFSCKTLTEGARFIKIIKPLLAKLSSYSNKRFSNSRYSSNRCGN